MLSTLSYKEVKEIPHLKNQ